MDPAPARERKLCCGIGVITAAQCGGSEARIIRAASPNADF